MSDLEDIILDNLKSFRQKGSQNLLKDVLKILNSSTHAIDFNLLDKKIELHGLRTEWNLVRNIYFWQFVNF